MLGSAAWALLLVLLSRTEARSVKLFSCLDCHTLQISSSSPMIKSGNTTLVDCSKTKLPFCDATAGSCSATPSSHCSPRDNFTCITDGYFPDPSDCRVFHLCVDLSPTAYPCDPSTPSYYYYDVVLHRCAPTATCGYSCAGKTGVKVPHPADKNLYAFCYNGSAILQDRCPGNYEMVEESQTCTPACHEHGVLPDLDHCRKFFRCINQNGGFYMTHEQCPWGQAFHPLKLQCEPDLSYCSSSTSTTSAPRSTHDPFLTTTTTENSEIVESMEN